MQNPGENTVVVIALVAVIIIIIYLFIYLFINQNNDLLKNSFI